jgi:hypothetical protein
MTTATERITELTNAKLLEIYGAAYMAPTVALDGDVEVIIDGIKLFASADPARGVMRLMALFNARQDATRLQLLELCNRINDGLILLRASCPAAIAQNVLMLDHYVVTSAGVTGQEIVDETRRFRGVIANIPPLDLEHVMA